MSSDCLIIPSRRRLVKKRVSFRQLNLAKQQNAQHTLVNLIQADIFLGQNKLDDALNSIISKQMESSSGIYKWQFKRGLKKISKIIAASNVIKEDLIKFGISAEKITVVHNGIEHKLFYPMVDLNEDEIQIHPFAIKRPYFIYGSNINGPEKKHEELIKAFELFKKRTGLSH